MTIKKKSIDLYIYMLHPTIKCEKDKYNITLTIFDLLSADNL